MASSSNTKMFRTLSAGYTLPETFSDVKVTDLRKPNITITFHMLGFSQSPGICPDMHRILCGYVHAILTKPECYAWFMQLSARNQCLERQVALSIEKGTTCSSCDKESPNTDGDSIFAAFCRNIPSSSGLPSFSTNELYLLCKALVDGKQYLGEDITVQKIVDFLKQGMICLEGVLSAYRFPFIDDKGQRSSACIYDNITFQPPGDNNENVIPVVEDLLRQLREIRHVQI